MLSKRAVVKVGLSLATVFAVGLAPASLAEAQAASAAPAAAAKASKTVNIHKTAKGHNHYRKSCNGHGHRHGKRCIYVAPHSGLVERCKGAFTKRNHFAMVPEGVWSPEFEPHLASIGRTGAFFVYVGDTPVGWVEMVAEDDFGGTITLSTVYGDYEKGTQRLALYDSRGRLVAWDWITLDWDW